MAYTFSKNTIVSLAGACILLVLSGLLFIPVTQEIIISKGIDSYQTHSVLFKGSSLSQSFVLEGPLKRVGAIIVPYTKEAKVSDVTVKIYQADTNRQLAEGTIPADNIKDDTFAYATFNQFIGQRGDTVIIELSAPDTLRESMMAVRFDPNVNTTRFEKKSEKPGSFAIAMNEHVPLWLYIKSTVLMHKSMVSTAFIALLLSAAISFIALEITWGHLEDKKKLYIRVGIMAVLTVLACAVRFNLITKLGGVSGGDPYNYLLITDSITKLENPFSGTKRLPGYPLLLVPAYLSHQIDDITFMRSIQILSAGGVILLLPFLCLHVGIPWLIGFSATALLAFQKDFFWTSIRPEPYSMYAFLLVSALLLFFNLKKQWCRYLFSIALGFAAMTRQEGFLLALILGIASLFFYKQFLPKDNTLSKKTAGSVIKSYAQAFLPALLIVTPFFINNTLSFGNPLFTPYFEGERLQIVDSWPAFVDSIGATWGVLDSLWRISWDELDRLRFDDISLQLWFIILVGLFFLGADKKIRNHALYGLLLAFGAVLYLTSLYWQLFSVKSHFLELTSVIPSVAFFVGMLPIIYANKKRGILFIVVAISQILIATWFHPFPKHYQQSYPFLLVAMTAAFLFPIARTQKNRFVNFVFSTGALAPLIVTILLLHQSIGVAIDKNNMTNALDSVIYRSVQKALKYPGPYGSDQEYLQARLYFGDEGHLFPNEDNPTVEQQRDWLLKNNIKTLVTTTNNHVFSNPEPDWVPVGHVKSEGRDERLYEGYTYVLP